MFYQDWFLNYRIYHSLFQISEGFHSPFSKSFYKMLAKFRFIPFIIDNFQAFFKAKFLLYLFFMPNLQISECLIFEMNCVKFLKKIRKLLSLGNNWIMKKITELSGKIKRKKAEIPKEIYSWCVWQYSYFTRSFVCKYHLTSAKISVTVYTK